MVADGVSLFITIPHVAAREDPHGHDPICDVLHARWPAPATVWQVSTKAIPAPEVITLASGLGGTVWIEHADIAAA